MKRINIRKIAKQHGCKLKIITKCESEKYPYYETDEPFAFYYYGERKIEMYFFENYNHTIYSFFHELGHSFENKYLDLSRKKHYIMLKKELG